MQYSDWVTLGTDVPGGEIDWHEHGAWRFAFDGGGLRYVTFRGIEIIRGITFLSRDARWGVHPVSVGKARVDSAPSGLVIRWPLKVVGALALEGRVSVTDDALEIRVSGNVLEDISTARTGFAVLHPINTLAGQTIALDTPDESGKVVQIAQGISPAQPLKNIRALAFDNGCQVRIAFEADQPFEMEDQRNWTDASFKTYYRPLALPWPYTLRAGEALQQAVRVSVTGGAAQTACITEPEGRAGSAPSLGLVWLHDDPLPEDTGTLSALSPDWIAAQIDLRRDDAPARASEAATLAARLRAALRLRLILPDGADPSPMLNAVSEVAGPVQAVHALPAAFLSSHQPDGEWPNTLSCETAQAAARAAFPQAEIQAGMLTFFPEFNRHRPKGDYDAVSFGTAAIVHDADDRSVMETLEALPDVFGTAHASAGGKPVDIGLASIGLWCNPYGGKLVANPQWQRRPLTREDPRIRGLFGASWLVACLAQTIAGRIRSVGVGAVCGALGVLTQGPPEKGVLRPLAHVLPAFRALGSSVTNQPHPPASGWAGIMAQGRALVANTRPEPVVISLPGQRIVAARVLDAGTAAEAATDPAWILQPGAPVRGALSLPPYAIALLELEGT